MGTLELFLHPVRLRIVDAALDGRPFTTTTLSQRLPDVSKATVYRHLAVLVDGGLIDVVEERRVRGAVERTYRLTPQRPVIDGHGLTSLTPAEHERIVATVVAGLLAEYSVYARRPDADPAADGVECRQFALWLDEDERRDLVRAITTAIDGHAGNQPSPDRRRHLLTAILFPVQP